MVRMSPPLIPYGDGEDERLSPDKVEGMLRLLYRKWPGLFWHLLSYGASGVKPYAPRGGRAPDTQAAELDQLAERRSTVGGSR
jgi:hypothetical protein